MKKEIVMQSSRIVVMVFLMMVATTGVMAADSQEVPHDAAYEKAKEQMADMLASEDFEKVDISAASFDRAMDLIYIAVEKYLDYAVPVLGDAETAREFGVDVLQGLNEHKIHYAGDDGYNLVGDRRLLIAGEQDALDLGEVVARVAILIEGARGMPGINVRPAARKIFQGMVPAEGTGQSMISQYPRQAPDNVEIRHEIAPRFCNELARSRPETALFRNLVVRLRVSLCDVLKYDSAETLVFLKLIEKWPVSASGTSRSHRDFPDGNSPVSEGAFRRLLLQEPSQNWDNLRLLEPTDAVVPGDDAESLLQMTLAAPWAESANEIFPTGQPARDLTVG